MSPERQTKVIKDRFDPSRVAIAAGVAGGLGVGRFSAFFGAGVGLALGSALCALSIRRGSPLLSGLLAGLAAYVLVLAPALIYTDDVGLAEDLSPGGLGFLAFLLLPFGVFALLGATVGAFIAPVLHRDRMQKRHQH